MNQYRVNVRKVTGEMVTEMNFPDLLAAFEMLKWHLDKSKKQKTIINLFKQSELLIGISEATVYAQSDTCSEFLPL